MRFVEMYVPAAHRRVVDAFKRAIHEACAETPLATTAVEVKSDGVREFVVFTLADPLGGRTAAVECAPTEPPRQVGRRAYRAAGRMLHGMRA